MSGVNPTDGQVRSGAADPKHFSEATPHLDGASTIDAVGEGIDQSRVGRRVRLFMASADEAGFDVGASLGVPALTAHRPLAVAAGGTGAIGHAVIQLARRVGTIVIGAISVPA
ncbi:hypothetical protein ACFXKC_46435 [Streptomyces sp. NPDC059340]|uniref:hypothetical protein n=1 Tax=Streptomyces sp. NPDC059340 TaxID=3346806 RepID=UPI0036C1C0B8